MGPTGYNRYRVESIPVNLAILSVMKVQIVGATRALVLE
jgi:hypothetical protein